jgi:hypothetical protein
MKRCISPGSRKLRRSLPTAEAYNSQTKSEDDFLHSSILLKPVNYQRFRCGGKGTGSNFHHIFMLRLNPAKIHQIPKQAIVYSRISVRFEPQRRIIYTFAFLPCFLPQKKMLILF